MASTRSAIDDPGLAAASANALLEILRRAGVSVPLLRLPRRIIRRKDVLKKLGVASSTLNGIVSRSSPYFQAEFPKSFTLWDGSNIEVWDEDELDDYIDRRKAAR